MADENIFKSLLESQQVADQVVTEVQNVDKKFSTQPWSPELVTTLSVSILIFTSLSLILSTALLWRNNSNGLQILKVFGILAIIGLSTFLLIVAYDKDQLTPIVGLFGAIAGYLLGKDSSKADDGTIAPPKA